MSERKPIPMQTMPTRRLCPVCGKASYSRGGTHPQCLLAHADAQTRAARKAEGPDIQKPPTKKPWLKPCPKCQRLVPARRIACDCGHQFAGIKHETGKPGFRQPETISLE